MKTTVILQLDDFVLSGEAFNPVLIMLWIISYLERGIEKQNWEDQYVMSRKRTPANA